MKQDNTIQNTIAANLIAENQAHEAAHVSSGKLSASKLGWPTQWQILNTLRVETAPLDEYTLRKFLRGRTVEDWLVTQVPDVITTQKSVEYRDTIGYVDIVVDTKNFENKLGIIPLEVKSITNAKFKTLEKINKPDEHHCLQACLYALAMAKDHFLISYVASDDLRVKTFVVKTTDYKDQVEAIIDEYKKALNSKIVPVFKSLYKWQESKIYNQYPDWMELTAEEIADKMKRLNIHFGLIDEQPF